MKRTLLLLGVTLVIGCGAAPSASRDESPVVEIAQTELERQSIGGTWIHAHAEWVSRMHAAGSGAGGDLSTSYYAYWHWFDQIASGFAPTVATGGNWATANGIVKRYGVVAAADFAEARRYAAALAAVRASLTTGPLKDPGARRNRALVRRELDRAWGLDGEVSRALDDAFGPDVDRSFTSTTNPARPAARIARPQDYLVTYAPAPGQALVARTLSQAMADWREVYFTPAEPRAFYLRVQKGVHDGQPLLVTWFVDFNALEVRPGELFGAFNLTTLAELGAGAQGGHAGVVLDYGARLVDGREVSGKAFAGARDPQTAAAMAASLDVGTEVQSLQVAKAWGWAEGTRAAQPSLPAVHTLTTGYLEGPIARCVTRDQMTETHTCPSRAVPLQSVVFPPGY